MSLDKAIEHGKEHRKPWYDARAYDPWCRNHGNDTWYINLVLQGKLRRQRKISKLKLSEGIQEFFGK